MVFSSAILDSTSAACDVENKFISWVNRLLAACSWFGVMWGVVKMKSLCSSDAYSL
jgi:hypothetical protein